MDDTVTVKIDAYITQKEREYSQPTASHTDRLAKMLSAQEAFQRLMDEHGRAPVELSGTERKDYVRTHVLATTDELHEALRETVWKPWSNREDLYATGRSYFIAEMIDAWHHFMNLLLVADVTADEFFDEYVRKMDINIKRKTDGYISTTG